MRYRYWLTSRPAMPGTIPTKNLDRIENFDNRRFVEESGREVWGYVDYTVPLSDKEIWEYELIKGGEVND